MKFFQIIFAILSSVAVASTALATTDKESANHCHPENPNPEPYKISYEDGTESPSIRLRLWGVDHDSLITFEETLNGFTVGPSTTNDAGGGTLKYYTYRDVNLKTGELFDTGLIVGKADPQSNNINKFAAAKSERIKKNNENDKNDEKSKKSKKKGNKKKSKKKSKNDIRKHRTLRRRQGREFVNIPDEEGQSNRRVSTIASGTMKNLVVLFKFKDHASRDLPSRSDLDILMNNNGPAPQCPTGSVRDVYKQNSYNTLDIQSTVVDWITIDYTEAECAGGNSARRGSFFESTCLTNALDKLNATGFNFADFDVDGDGFMDGMAFLHSGYGAEFRGDKDAYGARYEDRIWSHRGVIWGVTWQSNGVRVYDYHVSPSVWGTSGSDIGRIGVIAHETGHFLGLPDLYDYGDGNGIGSWGLMGNSWGFDYSQLHPPLMSAWSKEQLGWVKSIVVSRTGTYSLDQACDNPYVIKITEGFPDGEYLLIENRQPCGFETKMPQGGLAIFHIDNNINHNIRGYPGQAGSSWPTNGKHYKVALLQADGKYHLEKSNRGDAGDVFHGCGTNSISPSGTSNGAYPNTNAYQGGNIVDTGVTISNIGPANYTMTFDIIFSSSTGEVEQKDELLPSGYLLRGDPPIFSKNRKYYLKFQLDGNLVLYDSCTSEVLWSSDTYDNSPNIDGASAYVTAMQGDGNLVIYGNDAYDGASIVLFATNTENNPGARLVVQNDGNLVIYNSSGFPIWAIW